MYIQPGYNNTGESPQTYTANQRFAPNPYIHQSVIGASKAVNQKKPLVDHVQLNEAAQREQQLRQINVDIASPPSEMFQENEGFDNSRDFVQIPSSSVQSRKSMASNMGPKMIQKQFRKTNANSMDKFGSNKTKQSESVANRRQINYPPQQKSNSSNKYVYQQNPNPSSGSESNKIAAYKKILLESGLQIHPRQLDMLNDDQVQEMLRDQQMKKSNLKSVIQNATNMQVKINQSIKNNQSTFDIIDKHKTQQKLDNELQNIIDSNFQEQVAEKLAKEISQNIKVTYDPPSQNISQNTDISRQTTGPLQPTQSHEGESEDPIDPELAETITDKMKKMSVYELYQIANSEDNTLIDQFIKQKLLATPKNVATPDESPLVPHSSSSPQTIRTAQVSLSQSPIRQASEKSNPAVAPILSQSPVGLKAEYRKEINIQRDIENIIDQSKMKNYNNFHSGGQLYDDNTNDELFLKHLKNQASIILETQDEHLASQSFEAELPGAGKKSMQYAKTNESGLFDEYQGSLTTSQNLNNISVTHNTSHQMYDSIRSPNQYLRQLLQNQQESMQQSKLYSEEAKTPTTPVTPDKYLSSIVTISNTSQQRKSKEQKDSDASNKSPKYLKSINQRYNKQSPKKQVFGFKNSASDVHIQTANNKQLVTSKNQQQYEDILKYQINQDSLNKSYDVGPNDQKMQQFEPNSPSIFDNDNQYIDQSQQSKSRLSSTQNQEMHITNIEIDPSQVDDQQDEYLLERTLPKEMQIQTYPKPISTSLVDKIEEGKINQMKIVSQEQLIKSFASPPNTTSQDNGLSLVRDANQEEIFEKARENAPERQRSARIEKIYNDTEDGIEDAPQFGEQNKRSVSILEPSQQKSDPKIEKNIEYDELQSVSSNGKLNQFFLRKMSRAIERDTDKSNKSKDRISDISGNKQSKAYKSIENQYEIKSTSASPLRAIKEVQAAKSEINRNASSHQIDNNQKSTLHKQESKDSNKKDQHPENQFYHRKVSSPQPLRLSKLQQKYAMKSGTNQKADAQNRKQQQQHYQNYQSQLKINAYQGYQAQQSYRSKQSLGSQRSRNSGNQGSSKKLPSYNNDMNTIQTSSYPARVTGFSQQQQSFNQREEKPDHPDFADMVNQQEYQERSFQQSFNDSQHNKQSSSGVNQFQLLVNQRLIAKPSQADIKKHVDLLRDDEIVMGVPNHVYTNHASAQNYASPNFKVSRQSKSPYRGQEIRVQTQDLQAANTINFNQTITPLLDSEQPSANTVGDSMQRTPTNNQSKILKKGVGKSKSQKKYARIESKLKTAGKLHAGKNMTIKQYVQHTIEETAPPSNVGLEQTNIYRKQLSQTEYQKSQKQQVSIYEKNLKNMADNMNKEQTINKQQQRVKSKSPNSGAYINRQQNSLQASNLKEKDRPKSSNQSNQKQQILQASQNRVSYKHGQEHRENKTNNSDEFNDRIVLQSNDYSIPEPATATDLSMFSGNANSSQMLRSNKRSQIQHSTITNQNQNAYGAAATPNKNQNVSQISRSSKPQQQTSKSQQKSAKVSHGQRRRTYGELNSTNNNKHINKQRTQANLNIRISDLQKSINLKNSQTAVSTVNGNKVGGDSNAIPATSAQKSVQQLDQFRNSYNDEMFAGGENLEYSKYQNPYMETFDPNSGSYILPKMTSMHTKLRDIKQNTYQNSNASDNDVSDLEVNNTSKVAKSQPPSNLDPDAVKVTEQEIKQLRIKMQNAVLWIQLVNLREADQIKKPQKHIYYSAKQFKILFDLIQNASTYFKKHKEKSKKVNYMAQIKKFDQDFNKDLVDDLGGGQQQVENGPNENEDLEFQIQQKALYKLLMHADVELKRFSYHIQQEMTKTKEKEMGIKTDIEIMNEWTQVIKPFLCQNNLTFQQNIQNMSKNLKRLIESNRDHGQNLRQIQMFAEKIVDILVTNQSLTSQCIKVGNNGSVFGKMLEVVRYCCLYTIKKSQKELSRQMDISSTKTPFALSHLSHGDEEELNENIESTSQMHNQNALIQTIQQEQPAYFGRDQDIIAIKIDKKQGSDPSPKQREKQVFEEKRAHAKPPVSVNPFQNNYLRQEHSSSTDKINLVNKLNAQYLERTYDLAKQIEESKTNEVTAAPHDTTSGINDASAVNEIGSSEEIVDRFRKTTPQPDIEPELRNSQGQLESGKVEVKKISLNIDKNKQIKSESIPVITTIPLLSQQKDDREMQNDIFEYQAEQDGAFEDDSSPLFKLNLIPVDENQENKFSSRISKHGESEGSEQDGFAMLSKKLAGDLRQSNQPRRSRQSRNSSKSDSKTSAGANRKALRSAGKYTNKFILPSENKEAKKEDAQEEEKTDETPRGQQLESNIDIEKQNLDQTNPIDYQQPDSPKIIDCQTKIQILDQSAEELPSYPAPSIKYDVTRTLTPPLIESKDVSANFASATSEPPANEIQESILRKAQIEAKREASAKGAGTVAKISSSKSNQDNIVDDFSEMSDHSKIPVSKSSQNVVAGRVSTYRSANSSKLAGIPGSGNNIEKVSDLSEIDSNPNRDVVDEENITEEEDETNERQDPIIDDTKGPMLNTGIRSVNMNIQVRKVETNLIGGMEIQDGALQSADSLCNSGSPDPVMTSVENITQTPVISPDITPNQINEKTFQSMQESPDSICKTSSPVYTGNRDFQSKAQTNSQEHQGISIASSNSYLTGKRVSIVDKLSQQVAERKASMKGRPSTKDGLDDEIDQNATQQLDFNLHNDSAGNFEDEHTDEDVPIPQNASPQPHMNSGFHPPTGLDSQSNDLSQHQRISSKPISDMYLKQHGPSTEIYELGSISQNNVTIDYVENEGEVSKMMVNTPEKPMIQEYNQHQVSRESAQAWIEELNQEVQIASAARLRPKVTTNPYVAQTRAGSGSDIQSLVNEYINRNKPRKASTDNKQTSFEMEHGRYHPTSGIPVYSIDTDFDYEEEFEIKLRKVLYPRGSSGASGMSGNPRIGEQPNSSGDYASTPMKFKQNRSPQSIGSTGNARVSAEQVAPQALGSKAKVRRRQGMPRK